MDEHEQHHPHLTEWHGSTYFSSLFAFGIEGEQWSEPLRQYHKVDPNGNTTTYTYDANHRLTTITDPVGLQTTLTYDGAYLSQITDPSGRVTTFSHDAQGNLVSVTYPDASQQSFAYDARQLMTSETDQRGQQRTQVYDQFGRVTQATMPDGSVGHFSAAQRVGVIDSNSGQGTADNPAPITRPAEAISQLQDGEGRQTAFELDALKRVISRTNPAGFSTTYEHDENGNPTLTTYPSGGRYRSTYDAQGNCQR